MSMRERFLKLSRLVDALSQCSTTADPVPGSHVLLSPPLSDGREGLAIVSIFLFFIFPTKVGRPERRSLHIDCWGLCLEERMVTVFLLCNLSGHCLLMLAGVYMYFYGTAVQNRAD